MIIESPTIEKARYHANELLKLLREERKVRPTDVRGIDGKRELSEAITCFETGSMWMIRSLYADEPYSPLQRLQKADS